MSNRLLNVLVFVSVPALCAADPVAMVTDLEGTVRASGSDLEILSELSQGDRVEVGADSSVNIVYYASGSDFRFNGPAELEIDEDSPNTLSGGEPEVDSVLPEGEGSISTVGLAQAAMVMRAAPNEPKLTLFYPADTVLLERPDAFRWQSLEEGVGYSFELTDPEGRALIETIVTGAELKVPDHIELMEGEYYNWTIETRLPDGRKFSNWASFSVADDSLRQEVADARPATDASISRLVVYALWLEQNELKVEAERYWQQVLEQRPGAARLAERVGR